MSTKMSGKFIANVTKEYPKMIKIIIYREPYYMPKSGDDMRISNRRVLDEEDEFKKFVADQKSIARTKSNLNDLIVCNEFEYFCTFTFDPKKYDRHNYAKCTSAINRYFQNCRLNHSPNLKYLVVPELHKDGAIHFHALISHFNGHLRDSGKKANGQVIFNITGYRAGFSTAVKIDGNHEVVANYLKKYITKDIPQFFNKKRYFCSRNLCRPIKTVNNPKYFLQSLYSKRLNNNFPLKNILPKKETPEFTIYEIAKNQAL